MNQKHADPTQLPLGVRIAVRSLTLISAFALAQACVSGDEGVEGKISDEAFAAAGSGTCLQAPFSCPSQGSGSCTGPSCPLISDEALQPELPFLGETDLLPFFANATDTKSSRCESMAKRLMPWMSTAAQAYICECYLRASCATIGAACNSMARCTFSRSLKRKERLCRAIFRLNGCKKPKVAT